jgi:hypothetical protein
MSPMRRRFVLVLPALFILTSLTVTARQADPTNVGPAVGARVPDFSGIDQFGQTQTLQTSAGAAGTMLVFFRSADW